MCKACGWCNERIERKDEYMVVVILHYHPSQDTSTKTETIYLHDQITEGQSMTCFRNYFS